MELQSHARYCAGCGCKVAEDRIEETQSVGGLKDSPPSTEPATEPVAPSTKIETPAANAVAEDFWYAAAPSASLPQAPSNNPVPATAEPPQTVSAAATTLPPDKVVDARVGTVASEAVKTEASPLKRAKSDAVHAQQASSSAVVSKRPTNPVASPRRRHPVGSAAIAVAGLAIGFGAYRLGVQKAGVTDPAEPPAVLAAKAAVTRSADGAGQPSPRQRPAAASAAMPEAKSTKAPSPKASTPSRARSAAPRAAAVPAFATAPATQLSIGDVADRLPVAAPPPPPAIEIAPPPAVSVAPVGPFFEAKDVSDSPRVAARVDPRVPEALKARSRNEIVIVRALVSQSGHPSRVSLLRRSKAGPELDAVVVEAVNQWTFAPARRKGEAVSCWLNFGVQLGGAD